MKVNKAFTQVEILSVCAILGALAAISIPRLMVNPDKARATSCQSNIVIINKVSDLYFNQNNKAATLDELTSNRDIFPDGPPQCPFGDPYTMSQYGHITPHHHNIEDPQP